MKADGRSVSATELTPRRITATSPRHIHEVQSGSALSGNPCHLFACPVQINTSSSS